MSISRQPSVGRSGLRLVLVACALLFADAAYAAQDELAEYQRRVKSAEVMGALGEDMFGD
jgi:hypothetical protein